MLRFLEEKGLLRHEWDGPRYAYFPTADPEDMRRSAARHLLRTFFNDSMESAVVAMLGVAEKRPSDEELKRLPRASAARHFMWASALAGALRLALVGPVAPPVTLAVPPAAGAPCA